MPPRPLSITIIAWYLIIASVLSLGSLAYSYNSPMVQEVMKQNLLPPIAQLALAVAGLAVSIACGIGMLKALAWSRPVYVGWSIFSIAVSFVTSHMKWALLPGLIVLAIIAYFLYRPKASEYFSGKASQESTDAA